VSAPPDQTVHSAQDAYYSGWHDFNLGSFTDPAGSAGGPWTVPSSGATAPPTTWRLTLRAH
jgi:hypothetical protein